MSDSPKVESSIPAHLASDRALGLREGEPIAQFEIGDLRNFVYLILDWRERKAAVVDPQRDLTQPLQSLSEHGFQLDGIMLTHTHHDHVAGVPGLLDVWPELPLYVHKEDQHRLAPRILSRCRVHNPVDGDVIRVGGLSVHAHHTPGHSAGEICFFLQASGRAYLLSGDTVFIRDCGRTDLPTGSTEQMFHTLQRLKKLPGGTILLPGHHYTAECASTLEREFRESPPFRCASAQELDALD